jgi:hypothetical protein
LPLSSIGLVLMVLGFSFLVLTGARLIALGVCDLAITLLSVLLGVLDRVLVGVTSLLSLTPLLVGLPLGIPLSTLHLVRGGLGLLVRGILVECLKSHGQGLQSVTLTFAR